MFYGTNWILLECSPISNEKVLTFPSLNIVKVMPSKKQKAIAEIYERMKKTKKNEMMRIQARRKAQKKGQSLATQKASGNKPKPVRQKRRVTKKRSSIR